MKQKTLWVLVSFWTSFFNAASIAYACSVCITGANDPTADAFNWSVLFLMAMPYLVVGSIAGGLFYTHRRSAAKREKTIQPLVHLALNPEENGR